MCGASWACTDSRHPNTHFTELLAEHFICDYENYALPGCSNDVICLQIQQALNDGCDALVVHVEMPDRLTIPYPDKSYHDFTLKNIKSKFDFKSHPFLASDETKSYISANHVSLLKKTITIGNKDHIKQDYKSAVRKYVDFLYSNSKQSVTDSWMFSYFLHKSVSQSVMLCIIIDQRNPILPHLKNFQKNIISNNVPFTYRIVSEDPLYHTDVKSQRITYEQVVKHFDKY